MFISIRFLLFIYPSSPAVLLKGEKQALKLARSILLDPMDVTLSAAYFGAVAIFCNKT